MPNTYFHHIRTEIAPLLPASAMRILDLGAGAGVTGKWLKTVYPDAKFVAVEGNDAWADELRSNADDAHVGDINTMVAYLGSYDLVLCLDILEHLVSPEAILRRIVEHLPLGATVIISLPNVAHLSVSVPLLISGSFEYRDEGILDRTHLHFYTENSALALAHSAGLTPKAGVITGLNAEVAKWIDRFSLGLMRKRLAFQYIFSAQKLSSSESLPIRWQIAKKT